MKSLISSLLELPQTAEAEWYVDRTPLEGPDAPTLMLWLEASSQDFRGFTLSDPSDPAFLEMLSPLMLEPDEGEPCRPSRVIVSTSALRTALAKVLKPLRIEVHQKHFEPEIVNLMDRIRPDVVRQFLIGICLDHEVPPDVFSRLIAVLEILEKEAPWNVVDTPGETWLIEGLGEAPVAVSPILEEDVKGIGVVDGSRLIREALTPEALEREALWILFESRLLTGCVADWPWVGRMENQEEPLNEAEAELLITVIEAVLRYSELKAPAKPVGVRLWEFVVEEMEVTVGKLSPPEPRRSRNPKKPR